VVKLLGMDARMPELPMDGKTTAKRRKTRRLNPCPNPDGQSIGLDAVGLGTVTRLITNRGLINVIIAFEIGDAYNKGANSFYGRMSGVSTRPEERFVSVEEYLALDDDGLVEYDHGRLIWMLSVSNAHSIAVTWLIAVFMSAVGDQCVVLGEPAKLKPLRDEDVFVMPDIFVVCGRGKVRNFKTYVEGAPELVVEVLSPSTEMDDRVRKMRYYLKAGIPEYWIVDLDNGALEIYLLKDGMYEAVVLNEGDTVEAGRFAGMKTPDIFGDVLGRLLGDNG
jgi:Uma2 family endonuclease